MMRAPRVFYATITTRPARALSLSLHSALSLGGPVGWSTAGVSAPAAAASGALVSAFSACGAALACTASAATVGDASVEAEGGG